MNGVQMRFLLLFFCTAMPLSAFQLSEIRILEYSVDATINERGSTITGVSSVWMQISVDSITRFRFTVPSTIAIASIRDIDDDDYTFRREFKTNATTQYSMELPALRYRSDSIFVKIAFAIRGDTILSSSLFLGTQEFLLPYSHQSSWLPQFDSLLALRASLRFNTPDSVTVMSGLPAVRSEIQEKRKIWEFESTGPLHLTDIFTVCGFTSLNELRKTSNDSLVTIALHLSPSRFDRRFADSLLSYLVDAASYFRNLSGNTRSPFSLQYVILGESDIDNPLLKLRNTVIGRNSPAYGVFDSSVFLRSTRNKWLFELARSFCPPSNDSTSLFEDGWAGYLATKYILHKFKRPDVERQERLDIMINAMSFYPTKPLAAGRTMRPNEMDVVRFKGRYFFLMLEHLLGSSPFNIVIRNVYERYSLSPIRITDFRALCEKEYGSSLEKFFQQWLYRSTVPEFVMQWSAQNTQRGSSLATVIIEQRGELYSMPITLSFTIGNKSVPKRVLVDKARQTFTFTFSSPPKSVEIDPNYSVLRWILDIRILAHAHASQLFRVFDQDILSSEREALLTLDLDPVNATGSAPIAYFSLGKLAVLKKDPEGAKEYFFKAMYLTADEEAALYPLLSLVRYANVLEMEGNRSEAVVLYERAKNEGEKNPSTYAPVIVEAKKYLRVPFKSSDEFWFGFY